MDVTTMVAGVELEGIVPPDEARNRYREFWQRAADAAQHALDQEDTPAAQHQARLARGALNRQDLPVTYWQGLTRLDPGAEEPAQ